MKQIFRLTFILITILCTACSPASRIESCSVSERSIPETPNIKLLWSKSKTLVYSDPLNPSLIGLNSTVFAVVYKPNDTSSQLVALDAQSGKMRWQKKVTLPVTIVASDPFLYAGMYDKIQEYDPQTGNLAREIDFSNVGAIYNMFVNEQSLFALTNSGKWLVYNLEDNTSELSESFLPYTPFIIENGILYSYDSEGFKAIKTVSGETLWEHPINEAINSHPLFVADMIIVLSVTGNIYGLNKENGDLIWKSNANVISNVTADTSQLYFLASDGYLKVLNISDGQELQKLEISSAPFSTELPSSTFSIGVYNIWVDSQNKTVIFSLGDSCQLMAIKLEDQ